MLMARWLLPQKKHMIKGRSCYWKNLFMGSFSKINVIFRKLDYCYPVSKQWWMHKPLKTTK
eukprot:1082216-Ditylum_brightwellii.AAC.1